MSTAPQLKTVIPSYSYTSSQWDDPNDTWDSSTGTWDGSSQVQTQNTDQVLVDVLSSIVFLFLPLLSLVRRFF